MSIDAVMPDMTEPVRGGRIPRPLVTAAILLLAFAIQVPLVLNPDLSWLLTVAERVLQGQRLGVDILELNPPASVLIYMPAAFLGLHAPVPPEIWVIALCLAAAVGSVRLTLRLLSPMLDADAGERAHVLLLALLTLVPLGNFGQREHIACIGLLPFVALAARRNEGSPVALPLALLAGLAGGLAMCIKPYFAAVTGLPLVWNAITGRSLRPLFGPEFRVGALVVIAYGLAAYFTWPQYFREYPAIVALTYLPYRESLPYMLTGGLSSFAALSLALLYLTRGAAPDQWRGAGVWLAATAGGVLCYLAQGKDFGYIRVPMTLFLLATAVLAPRVLDRQAWRGVPLPLKAAALAVTAGLVALTLPGKDRSAEFIAPLRELAPPRPSMLVVSDAGEIGQPLVRKLGGTWASGQSSQLVTAGALNLQEVHLLTPTGAVLAAKIVADSRQRLREDLTLRRPDVLMVDSERFHSPYDWLGWMRQDPVVAGEMDRHYRLARTVGGVGIWLRGPETARNP